MTKPTGKPRGRPKTRDYVTLMARVDVALADQVQRYARLHRQTVSDVLRDGLQGLLSEQDPWHPIMSDTNRDTGADSAAREELLSDRNKAAIAILDADAASDREYVSDTNRDDEDMVSDTKEDKVIVSDTKRDDETIVSDTKAVPAHIVSDTKADDADYNSATHSLGKLCPRTHNYRGTGQSVLRISNRHCRQCDREKFHERKQAKRQAAV